MNFYTKNKRLIWILIGTIAFISFWYAMSAILKTTLIPSPLVTLKDVVELFKENTFYKSLGNTFLRLLIALAISFTLGIVLAISSAFSSSFKYFLKPTMDVIRTIPTVAVVFILVGFFEPSAATIVVTTFISLPIIYESILTGFLCIDEEIIKAAKLDGANTFKLIFKIYLPLADRSILLGFVSTLGLGMKVVLMAEVLAGANVKYGIGSLIRIASLTGDMRQIFACTVIALIIIGLMDLAVNLIKRRYRN